MYQAHYHGPGFDLVQVALQIRQVVRGPEEKPSKWLSTFRQATRQIVATPSIDCAVRFATKGKRLERTLLITAPEHAEDRVQYLAGVILQLNAVVDGSVLCALNRTQHDEITSQFPKICGRLSIEPVEMNRCWLTHDFRMFSQLELLMAEALHREVEAAWQINARYSQANSEDTRALRKNLVLIESESSIPARVAELQRKIWNHMEASSFLIDELVGFKSESDSRRIQQILGQQFAAGLGKMGFTAPHIDWEEDMADLLATGFHTSYLAEFEPFQKAAMSASSENLAEWICWQPPIEWDGHLLTNSVVESDHEVEGLRKIETQLGHIEQLLRQNNAAFVEAGELRKALEIYRVDPLFALAKSRQIMEQIVGRVYRDHKPGARTKPLFNMVEELTAKGDLFPRSIATYLHTIRILGNLVVHGGSTEQADHPDKQLGEVDVELTLLMTLRLVEWFLVEYTNETG
jgi:hypothetical protein